MFVRVQRRVKSASRKAVAEISEKKKRETARPIAEFNVVGNCRGSRANFNPGSTIVPRTQIFYGGTAPPDCVAQGFTGETNNLSFPPTAPPASPPGPGSHIQQEQRRRRDASGSLFPAPTRAALSSAVPSVLRRLALTKFSTP